MSERISGAQIRTPRAAVVGSGFGGLAAAIRLQAAGIPSVLFEARDKPGGRAYVYEQDGFVFDAGPTVITAPHCIEELFEVAGRRMEDYVELLPVTPFYRLERRRRLRLRRGLGRDAGADPRSQSGGR